MKILLTFLFIIQFNALRAQQATLKLPFISSASIDKVRFSKDGKLVLTTSTDLLQGGNDLYQFWDPTNGNYLQTINSGSMNESMALWSDDSGYLIIFGNNFKTDFNVECWDVPKHQLIWSKSTPQIHPSGTICGTKVLITTGKHTELNNPTIFDIATGDSLGSLNTHHKEPRFFCSSADGKYYAVATCTDCDSFRGVTNDTVYVFHSGAIQPHANFLVQSRLHSISFSQNTDLILSKTDSTIQVNDAESGQQKFNKRFSEELNYCEFNNQGSAVVTSFHAIPTYYQPLDGGYIQFWDNNTGKCVDSLTFPKSYVSISLNRNDSKIAVTRADSLLVIDLKTGKRDYAWFTDPQGSHFNSVAYNPVSDTLAAGLTDGAMIFLDPVNKTILRYAEGFTLPMVKARFTSNNTFLTWNDHGVIHELEGGMENFMGYGFINLLKKWSVKSGKQSSAAFKYGVSSARITVSPSGLYALTIDKDKGGTIWNTKTGLKVSSFRFNPDWEYSTFVFSRDEQKFGYSTINKIHSIHIYHLENRYVQTGKLVKSISLINGGEILGVTPHWEYALVSGYGGDGDWRIFDMKTSKIVSYDKQQKLQVGYYLYNDDRELFLPDGKSFPAFKNATLYLNRFTSVKGRFELNPLKIGRDSMGVSDVQISPSGKILAARKDSIIYTYNTSNGHLIDSMNVHGRIDQYQFLKDGSGIISAGVSDLKINISGWKFTNGIKSDHSFVYEIMPFERDVSLISMSISPDQKLAVFSASNGHVICYDLNASKLLYSLLPLEFKDSFVFDQEGHFDGTKLTLSAVYYGCGMRAVSKDRLKETSQEAGLISKIMELNPAPIKSKGIAQLNICH